MDIVVHGIIRESIPAGDTVYDGITVPRHTVFDSGIGKPQIPRLSYLLGIPDGAQITVNAQFSDDTLLERILCYPYQGMQFCDSSYPFMIDSAFYMQDTWYSAPDAEVVVSGIWRDFSVASVQVSPVTYNPAQRALRIQRHLTVNVQYTGGEYTHKALRPWLATLYANHLANFGQLDVTLDPSDEPGVKYLVISHTDFAASNGLGQLLAWHNLRGIRSRVVSGSNWNYTTIRNAIIGQYTSDPSLRWVLLVGDVDRVPIWRGDVRLAGGRIQQNYFGDYGYASLEQDLPDHFPEIGVARLSVTSVQDLDNQVAKILRYQREPDLPCNWLTKLNLVVHRTMTTWGGEILNQIRDRNSFYSYTTDALWGENSGTRNSDVTSAINQGRNIVYYFGHGVTRAWKKWNTANESWTPEQVQNLQNGQMTPVVFQFACSLGNAEADACLSEEWLRKSSGGAVASMGANNRVRGMSGQGNHAAVELARCLGDEWRVEEGGNSYVNPASDFGWTMCNWIVAMACMYNYWDDPLHFMWFGDPAMAIWMGGMPESPQVSYPRSLPLGHDIMPVSVVTDNRPVQGALVCVSDPGHIYATAYTDRNGNALLVFDTDHESYPTVSVTGGHAVRSAPSDLPLPILPYLGDCMVREPPQVRYLGHIISDPGPGGNNDGILGPGETVHIPVTVRNEGLGTAVNCFATLHLAVPDKFVEIDEPQTPLCIGTLPSQGTGTTQGEGFWVRVSSRCPDGHMIHFTLRCTDQYGGSWESPFMVMVCAPLSISTDSFATYPAQARHLARNPNSNEFHVVYQSNGNIFYQMSPNRGQDWLPAELLSAGRDPCISLDFDGLPWVTFICQDSLIGMVRRNTAIGGWRRIRIFYDWKGPAATLGTTSMVCSNWRGGSDLYPDMGYVAFTQYQGETDTLDHGGLLFAAFDTIYSRGEYYGYNYFTYEVDRWNQVSDIDSFPCLARTPGDLIHILWQKGSPFTSPDGSSEICYATTLLPFTPDWLRAHPGQCPEFSPAYGVAPRTSEAPPTSPFVEAYGDSVFAVWRQPQDNPEGPGSIYRRARGLDAFYDQWSDWVPQDDALSHNESSTPVMSTREVVVWREKAWDQGIWLRCAEDPNPTPTFCSPNVHTYPHVNVNWTLPPGPPYPEYYNVYELWTEQVSPNIYAVRFGDFHYRPPPQFETMPRGSFYTLGIGESAASPYCLERDGFQRYRNRSVDFATNQLRYQLRYLHPLHNYRVRATLYHETPGRCRVRFSLGDSAIALADCDSGQASIVWFNLPQHRYRGTNVELKINRVSGSRVELAGLKLFQYEDLSLRRGGGGQEDETGTGIQSEPTLTLPTLMVSEGMITYDLPVASRVSLGIFDLAGRLVRTLEFPGAGPRIQGRHVLIWNLRDDLNRPLANGIYFCRLQTESHKLTTKFVVVQ